MIPIIKVRSKMNILTLRIIAQVKGKKIIIVEILHKK